MNRLRTSIFLVLSVLFPFLAWAVDSDHPTLPADGALEYAFSLLNQGDLETAEKQFRSILELNPEHAETLRGLGVTLSNKGLYDDAYDVLSRSYAVEQKGYTAYDIGVVENRRKNPETAENWYRRALELGFEKWVVFASLGDLVVARGDFEAGIPLLNQALGSNADWTNGWYLLGYSRYQLKEPAASALGEAIRRNPEHIGALYYRGLEYERRRNYPAAISDYRRVLALENRDPAVWYFIGRSLIINGEFSEGKNSLEQSIELGLKNSEVYRYLGKAWAGLENHDRAEINYLEMVNLGQDEAWIHYEMALYYRSIRERAKALPYYDRAIALAPDWAVPLNGKGLNLNEMHRYREAVAPLEAATELDPDWSWPFNNLGNAYERVGRLDDAAKAFKRSIEIDPEYWAAWYNFGTMYMDHYYDDRKAADYLLEAHRLNPNNLLPLRYLAKIAYRNGFYDEAISAGNAAIRINGTDELSRGYRGLAHLNSGNARNAVIDLQVAIGENGDFALWREGMGRCYMELENWPAAYEELTLAIELKPEEFEHLRADVAAVIKKMPEITLSLVYEGAPLADFPVTIIPFGGVTTGSFRTDNEGRIKVEFELLQDGKRFYVGQNHEEKDVLMYINDAIRTHSWDVRSYRYVITDRFDDMYPADGTVMKTAFPMLRWNPGRDFDLTKIRIFSIVRTGEDSRSFDMITQENMDDVGYYFPSEPLTPGEYSWNVKCFDENGIPVSFGYSEFYVEER